MREVISIEVLGVDAGEVRFRDVLSTVRSVAADGGHRFGVGDQAVVEVGSVRGRREILRVLSTSGRTPAPEAVPAPVSESAAAARTEPHPVLVGGVPYAPGDEAAADDEVAVGQVRVAEIGFSAWSTAERDAGRTAKRRPCVIVEIDGDWVVVCPIHGANSAVRRSGRGRRLLGWKALGLRKSSVVSAETTRIPIAGIGPLIGILDATDHRRLVGG